MKLKSVLKKLSSESLRRITEFWEIPPPPSSDPDEVVEFLYPRLQQKPHFEAAFRKLAGPEKELIQFLAMHGGDLEKAEPLERLYQGQSDAMDALVAALSEKGFVFYDKIVEDPASPLMVGLPEPYLRFIELPAYWEGYLGHFLRRLTNQQIRQLAAHALRLTGDSTRKDYLLNEIRNYLLNPRTLRQHLDSLSEDQRTLFQMLVECRGVCLYRDLLEMGFQKRSDHSKADHINTLLQQSGLVFTAAPGANKYSNLLMIPRDIYYIVTHHFQPDRRSLRELDTVSAEAQERGPGMILDNSNTLLRDLVIFAAQINRMNVRPLANGGIGKNDLKKILPRLSRYKTLKYCQFLGLFLLTRKFLVPAGDQFRISNQFLHWIEDSHAAYEQLITWWLDAVDWNEEFLEGDVLHADLPPGNLVNITEYRRLVIEHILEAPPDRWLSFRGFAESLNPQIEAQIPRRNPGALTDRHNRSNALVTESVIAETLYWLGLTALGVDGAKDLELIGSRIGNGRTQPRSGKRGRPRKQKSASFTFRLTDLGRQALAYLMKNGPPLRLDKLERLGDCARFLDCTASTIIIQPNFEALAPPDLALRDFYHLNEFMDIQSVDVMSTLQINRESVRSGMDHGLHSEDILGFLKRMCQERLPETVERLISETSERHGDVNMGYAGGYLIVDDPILLEEIRSNRRLSAAIKDVVDDRLVLLNANVNVRKLARELQKIGFMPHLASEHVHIVDEDTYHLSLTKEDIYTLFAALKFLLSIEETLGAPLTEDKASQLAERLKPDARVYFTIQPLAENLKKTWAKNFDTAFRARIDEIKKRAQSQLSRIASVTQSRRATKYSFSGPNPAKTREDLQAMVEFAIENEFEIEILYVKADGSEVTDVIRPESLERGKVYAFCRGRGSYAVFSLDRILSGKLV